MIDYLCYDSAEFDEFIEDFIDNSGDESLQVENDDANDGNGSVSSISNYDSSEKSSTKRRKRKYVMKAPRPVQVPRVLMFDIRKCYAKMIVNVMNSGDFPLLYGFIETYFAPNAHHTSTKAVTHGDSRNVFSMDVYGSDELVKYWYSFMNLTPDGITTLFDATIQHTTGKVVTGIHKDATQIYELRETAIPNSEYLEYILIQESKHDRLSFSSRDCSVVSSSSQKKRKTDEMEEVEDKKRRMKSIMSSVESAVSGLVLRKSPLRLSVNGTFSIYTDENKRITRMEASVEY